MKKSHTEAVGPVLIKKYENRRLYSSTAGRHLTLTEVAEIVRSGQSIRVVDAATDQDITSEILTQILLEQGRARGLPVDFLTEVIRMQEDLVGGYVDRVISGGLGLFWQAQKAATEAGLKEMAKLYEGIARSGRDMAAPFLGVFPWVSGSRAADEASEAEDSGGVRGLHERIHELESRLAAYESEAERDLSKRSRKNVEKETSDRGNFASTKSTKVGKKRTSKEK